MAGQEEEEEEAANVWKVSTGAGVDNGLDLESTLGDNPDPEPEIKPAWTFNGKGLIRSDSDD